MFFCLLSEDDARKKWRNLRDQFIKEFKKIPKGKSGDSQDRSVTYTGKWQYFKNLIFLKDTVVPRETEGNVPRLEVSEDTEVPGRNENELNEDEDWEEAASINSNINIDTFHVDPSETQTLSGPRTTEILPTSSKSTLPRSKRKRAREENIEIERQLLDLSLIHILLLD